MGFVQALPFETARKTVLESVVAVASAPASECVPLNQCTGRVLARQIFADRSYPPFARSARDGFAVRSSDFPGSVAVVGEVRAGSVFDATLEPGQAVEIMTGAPVPNGADAIIMIEQAALAGNVMTTGRSVVAGDHIVPAGAEIAGGSIALPAGIRLSFTHIAVLATIGIESVPVFVQPQVAIVATGDELVGIHQNPLPHQIRNSNSHTLAAQVSRAGGIPRIMPVARDDFEATRTIIEEALSSDLLLLSGGVSAGKYDLVEQVLADLGAVFFFDRVLIQPGQPLVFGRVRDRFFFGLPGNPVSTCVTFELFARAALDLLSGRTEAVLPLRTARLSAPFRHKPGLTRFLPATLHQGEIAPVPWQGSGDIFALARSNAFLVARADREFWPAGDYIETLTA